MPALRLILTALAAVLAAAPARAELIGWRFMSGDLEATTSTCIGSDETPACTVETVIACTILVGTRLWRGSEICDAAESFGLDTLPLAGTLGLPPNGVYFYLMDIWPLEEDETDYRWLSRPLPGDLIIDLYTGNCVPGFASPDACLGLPFQDVERRDPCARPDENGFLVPDASFIVRGEGDGWRVLSYRTEWTDAQDRFCGSWRPERWRRDASDLFY